MLTIPLPISLLTCPCAVLAVWWVGGGGCGWQAASTWRPSALQLLSHPQRVLERPGGESLCQVSCHYQHMFLGCNVWNHPLVFFLRVTVYSDFEKNIYSQIIFSPLVCRLMGSYGSLKGGNISEGMEDFTGGIAYSMEVSSRTPRVLWRSLTAALSRGSLLSCFIQVHAHLMMSTLHRGRLIQIR